MNKLIALIGAIVLAAVGTAPAAAQDNSSFIQYPCKFNSAADACAIVNKIVAPQASPKDIVVDVSAAKSVFGKARVISVIYVVSAKTDRYGPTSVALTRGHQRMISDVSAKRPSVFYLVSTNGGKTWTKILSTEPDAVIDSTW